MIGRFRAGTRLSVLVRPEEIFRPTDHQRESPFIDRVSSDFAGEVTATNSLRNPQALPCPHALCPGTRSTPETQDFRPRRHPPEIRPRLGLPLRCPLR